MTSQELEALIAKGQVPTLCYFYGEEQFLIERAIRRLLERAIDFSLKDFNLNVFFGNEVKGVEILDSAQTLPMFSERRAVLVKRAEALKTDTLDSLLPYLSNPAATTCLIFSGVKIDLRKKFFQELKKQNALVEYKRLYDNKLPGFIQNEITGQGKQIEAAAAEMLAFLIGNNLQELSSQIEKLTVYSGTRERITVNDVRTISSNTKAFTAFELARFIGMKDLPNSLRSLDALFRNGDDTPLMIGALSRHFRQLWKIRELLDYKVSQTEIGKQLNINSFFLGDLVQQAKRFSRRNLLQVFEKLYHCDTASKTGGHPYTLMHGLVMHLCLST